MVNFKFTFVNLKLTIVVSTHKTCASTNNYIPLLLLVNFSKNALHLISANMRFTHHVSLKRFLITSQVIRKVT